MFGIAVLVAAMAGCGQNAVPGDTVGYDFGISDVIAHDLNTDTFDAYQFPDMGGNGLVSVTEPSAELLVRITTPSNRGYAATQGETTALAGLFFGTVESFWFEMNGVTDGKVLWTDNSPYWQTDIINLSPGENKIRVYAIGHGDNFDPDAESVQVWDEIVVTYNPSFYFPAPLRMNPPSVFVGRNQPAQATIEMGIFGQSVADRIYVVRQNDDGTTGASLGALRDLGMVDGSSDEIQGDGVYTARVMVNCDKVGTQLYRAAVDVTTGSTPYQALSAPFAIKCLNNIDSETCSSHLATLVKARKAFYAQVEGGNPDGAVAAAMTVFSADSTIVETSDEDDRGGGVWVRFSDGVLGALNLAAPGARGAGDADGEAVTLNVPRALDGNQITSRQTLLMSPFSAEFGEEDEIQEIATVASGINCPVFTVKGPYNGSGASLEKFRQLSSSGIIGIATHSDVYFRGLSDEVRDVLPWKHRGGQEVLWSGEAVNCGRISSSDQKCNSTADCPAGSTCVITEAPVEYDDGGVIKKTEAEGLCYDRTHADMMAGRVILGDGTWGLTPEFIEFYADGQRFPGSIVYLGGCRTLYNGTLALSFVASGARTVTGYSNRVTSKFAFKSGYDYFFNIMQRSMTTGEAYAGGAVDPSNQGSFFRLFGALEMSASETGILNPGFEISDLTAWTQQGDGRVISRLGATKPIAGKFMGIISTGLGFTDKTGLISQSFCIPAGAKEVVFYWKYYSEEFHEFCGSAYQDTFQARLLTKDGTEFSVIDLAVDDLCAPTDGKCETCVDCTCGSDYIGLEPSDVQFDRGDTHMTDWQKSTFPLTGLDMTRDAPVTLSFYCTDKGDSIFDTAVLVDSVSFR